MHKKNKSLLLEGWGVLWLLDCIIKLLAGFGGVANLLRKRETIKLLFALIFWKIIINMYFPSNKTKISFL